MTHEAFGVVQSYNRFRAKCGAEPMTSLGWVILIPHAKYSGVIDGKRRDGSYAHVFCLGFLSPASGLRRFSDEEQMVRVFRGSGIPPHEVSRISQALKTRGRTLAHVTQQQAKLLHLVDHAS